MFFFWSFLINKVSQLGVNIMPFITLPPNMKFGSLKSSTLTALIPPSNSPTKMFFHKRLLNLF